MVAALDCVEVGAIQNGETEHTVVERVPLDSLHERLARGGIDHALVWAALYAWERWRATE